VFGGDESRFKEMLLFHFVHAENWWTQRGLYSGDYKYLASISPSGSNMTHELYNLKNDPFELSNLMTSEETVALDMARRMLSYMDRVRDNRNIKNTLPLRAAIQNKINELGE
jgi:arylsulfatase A-like enzyme